MKLSKDFYLSEFEQSQTATRYGIDNRIPADKIQPIKKLCVNTLQPLRDIINSVLTVTSGYRCLMLNRKLKSKDYSQHVKGEAADIVSFKYSVDELIIFVLKNNIPFDQMINEFDGKWLHISLCSNNRGRILKAIKKHGRTKYIDVTQEYKDKISKWEK